MRRLRRISSLGYTVRRNSSFRAVPMPIPQPLPGQYPVGQYLVSQHMTRHHMVSHRTMSSAARIVGAALALAVVMAPPTTVAQAAVSHYEARYRAQLQPASGTIHVELTLSGAKLPSKLVFHADPQRHHAFKTGDAAQAGSLEHKNNRVTWRPQGKVARLNYDFVVDHEKRPGSYDSRMSADWALFRGDKMVPKTSVTAVRGLQSRTTLEFVLPPSWSIVTAYPDTEPLRIDDPRRSFDRPKGWMLAGKLGTRSETIAGVQTIVAAPTGQDIRRQDLLAFLSWNLPVLAKVFPTLPPRLLIVTAGDPMWRGGLSGPTSLFVHASRPLISENRTSTLLHELVHVAMGIRGDEESDWIVEGFAEFYSIETLRRSRGISQKRYEEAMKRLDERGRRSMELFGQHSTGARTSRAVTVLKAVDSEIRAATQGRASLDQVAHELATRRGEVGLDLLQSVAARVAGRPLRSLERSRLLSAGRSAGPAS